MTGRQKNYLTMYKVVIAAVDENIGLLAPIAGLHALYTHFKTRVGLIEATVLQQELVLRGVAKDKRMRKQQLAKLASITAQLVYSYARSKGDYTLKAEVHFGKNKLMKYRDEIMMVHCERIYERAVLHLAELGAYGLTAGMLAELQSALNGFGNKKVAPTVAIDERKVATDNLKLYIGEVNALLKEQLDMSMRIFELNEPDFYRLYRNARKITDA